MMETQELERFITAQEGDYQIAFNEIVRGCKRSHWMWYIFPQLKGLGFSETAQYYGIKDKKEAMDYLNHPVLGERLISITTELMAHKQRSALDIFGSPDDIKLRSCMTLFAALPNSNPIFEKVIQQFFQGKKDERTEQLLNAGH